MAVGNGLQPCTSELAFGYMDAIEGYPALNNHRIVLVDTPGFDDTHGSDLTNLEKIATRLEQSYRQGAKLGGVIYLHDISAPRFSGAARRNLQIFRRMCGEDVLVNVVLGTTKWIFNLPDSESRHNQLVTDYWKTLIDKGAQACRFYNTFESAWSFIQALLFDREPNETVLQIQRELVNDRMVIPETRAGREFRHTLQEALDIIKKLQHPGAVKDEGLEDLRQEAQEKVKLLGSQIRMLKMPVSRRLRRLMGL